MALIYLLEIAMAEEKWLRKASPFITHKHMEDINNVLVKNYGVPTATTPLQAAAIPYPEDCNTRTGVTASARGHSRLHAAGRVIS